MSLLQPSGSETLKCILAIVERDRLPHVESELRHRGRRFTRLLAQGGFMRRGSAVLMLVVPPEQIEPIVGEIRAAAGPAQRTSAHEAEVGTVVFVLPLSEFVAR